MQAKSGLVWPQPMLMEMNNAGFVEQEKQEVLQYCSNRTEKTERRIPVTQRNGRWTFMKMYSSKHTHIYTAHNRKYLI